MRRLLVLAAFAVILHVDALEHQLYDESGIRILVQNSTDGIEIILERHDTSKTISVIGTNAGEIQSTSQIATDLELQFANNILLQMKAIRVEGPRKGVQVNVDWNGPSDTRFVDCVNTLSNNWYGGPQQKRQYWPIENLNLTEYSYITKEADNCGIAEPYWLSSEGIYLSFAKTSPLFITTTSNTTCFIAEVKAPYSSKRENNNLVYVIGIFDDVRQAHEHAVDSILHKPSGYPDEKMLTYPIWSTWARYKRDINHDIVIEFADDISRYGFPNSQLEIDDLWEVCYGSLTVDELRFPNMSNTVQTLKSKGYRVTVWAHPFINKGCEPWYTDAVNNKLVVASENGAVETSWWNDNGTTSSYVDFTKPAVRKWYVDRLRKNQELFGFDSYKFDAGETSWSPQIPVLQGDVSLQPQSITSDYVRTVAQFGPLVEVRAGYGTQDLPIFVRIIDKDSVWTFENGLPTLITTTLQMNLNGYTLVLPDMIGGNGYDGAPDKQLFIRWLQANTFMPSLQFSYVPWDYDNETVQISKKFVDLHVQYTTEIIKACERTVREGAPVNPPIWWIAPDDTTAHGIWDEYLLGEDILVAPVVVENATTRNIYLPNGTWLEEGDCEKVHNGPVWLNNHPAPLDVLPYFIRSNEDTCNSAYSFNSYSILLCLGLIVFLFN